MSYQYRSAAGFRTALLRRISSCIDAFMQVTELPTCVRHREVCCLKHDLHAVCHQYIGTTVYRGPGNFEPSRGICCFASKIDIFL